MASHESLALLQTLPKAPMPFVSAANAPHDLTRGAFHQLTKPTRAPCASGNGALPCWLHMHGAAWWACRYSRSRGWRGCSSLGGTHPPNGAPAHCPHIPHHPHGELGLVGWRAYAPWAIPAAFVPALESRRGVPTTHPGCPACGACGDGRPWAGDLKPEQHSAAAGLSRRSTTQTHYPTFLCVGAPNPNSSQAIGIYHTSGAIRFQSLSPTGLSQSHRGHC